MTGQGQSMSSRALVLGGGGVTGIAWEIGVLAGLAAAGIDLMKANVVIGMNRTGNCGGSIAWKGWRNARQPRIPKEVSA